jgi:PST family polysaccharide transporter
MGFDLQTLKKYTNHSYLKLVPRNSLSIILKIGIGLITSKLLAVFVGPRNGISRGICDFMTSLENATLGFKMAS